MPGVGTTHHVRLDDSYLIVHPNSYFKRAAPKFGARFATGDPSYDNLSFWQHWAQSCWIGGMGSESWEDDAMYDYGIGVDTSEHDVIALARRIEPAGTNFNPVSGERYRQFLVYKDELYCLLGAAPDPGGNAAIYKYDPDADSWSLFHLYNDEKEVYTWCRFAGDMYTGTSGTTLRKYNDGAWSAVKKPKGRKETPRVMAPYRQHMYVGFGRFLYRLKSDDKWDGSAVFFEGIGVDHYVAHAYHQGFLYFLTRNGHVIRTDGNATYDIHRFGGQVRGLELQSYDGKLFIATHEWYDNEDVGDLVIYQMSGAAVTELRRYGRVGKTTMTLAMEAVNRKLVYGASALLGVSESEQGFGLAVYDAREDAHSFWAVERDTVSYPDSSGDWRGFRVCDVIRYGKYLFISTWDHGVFRTEYSHRDIERGVAKYDISWSGTPAYSNEKGGVLVSSDFDAGTPGLHKYWRKIAVTADLLDTSVSVLVSYSTDGGKTWAGAGTMTKTGAATRYTNEFYLFDGSGNPIRSERLKYKLQLVTTDATYSPLVRSVVISYVPSPEPNWMWMFTAVLAENVDTIDGDYTVTQDVTAVKAALENAFRNKELVYFQDIDGEEWTDGGGRGVLIDDIAFSAPFIDAASEGPIEYTVQIQLLEAVETYP